MKVEISDAELSFISNLLKMAASKAPKEMAKRFKYLARRLEPPKDDIRLSVKNLVFLVSFLEGSMKVLSLREDEVSKAESQVLAQILNKPGVKTP